MKKLLSLLGLVLLAGCSGANSDMTVYQQNVGAHSSNEATRISAQAAAIATAATCVTCSKDAQAILSFSASQQISGLTPTPYSGKAPVTWTEVGKSVADQATGLANVGGWTYVGAKGVDALGTMIKNSGDTTTVNIGDKTSVEGFNKTITNQENHATAVGSESVPSVNNPQASQPLPTVGPELEE